MIDLQNLTLASPHEALLALNNAFATETSFLTEADWRQMVAEVRFAFHAASDGFILTFDQTAAYDSPNFLWFKARYDRFCYIDRVVIAASAQGLGLGKALYQHLFDAARQAGFETIVCEVNLDPPNPGSIAFHERQGFAAVGDQTLPNGKTVRYYAAGL
ncbi:acetyltransferase GNAT family protein [Asticcacaulis biprosthecium C19]|uniref:Acetyltransferase GNAT family protein n=1 Tax=Asticcacaulis biprosthecium C19 TaxID=715226 RepID=F4QRF7_9CAUL|nr:GNAT family N-acetyltransferase [Asticcacaulis biprosthecium]EGF90794.1 acetyltransferase GNAT family protein [Asticcacaulis biprosthecium C19]